MRDRTVGETFFMFFTTRAFATGVPTVLAGTPVVSAYEDASITQITAGITLGVDHDGVVGLNLLTLVATGANGYEAGKDYSMVITTGTVGGVSVVGEVVGDFSLGLSSAFTRLGAPAGASVSVDIADVPTVSEFNARTLVAASYFDPAVDAVANVTLVDTTTTNTDMRGTDSGALASVCTEGRLAELDPANLPAVTDAIKVPTDKMVFTVANQLDVNVQYWNDVVVSTALETSVDVRIEMDSNSTQLAAIVADTNELQGDWVNGGRLDLLLDAIPTTAMRGTDSAALASVCTEPRLAELDAANLPTDISNLNDVSIADILASQLTESYAADGVAPTLTQALFMIQQLLGDFAIVGTTLTLREIDGSTTAATFTLDSATTPTSITRAT